MESRSPSPVYASRAAPATTADRHAARVLADLGLGHVALPRTQAPHPDHEWWRSGGAWLSGAAPAPIAACMRGAFAVVEALASATLPSARDFPAHPPSLHDVDSPALLFERAAWSGLAGRGRTTAGGAGRLLRTLDGWIAAQLPRPDDVAAVPAWLECEPSRASTTDTSRASTGDTSRGTAGGASHVLDRAAGLVARRDTRWLVERARLLGLAVAALPRDGVRSGRAERPSGAGRAAAIEDAAGAWVVHTPPRSGLAAPRRARPGSPLRVLDLSTLWAGPLCGRLLAWAGADVVKVEHAARADGARFGERRFFDAMNGAKSNVAIDPTTREGRARLLALIASADVVIESARPRGLAQLGIDARACIDAHPGLGWVSITGYGRTPPRGEWIAFGDDAAVAAGLVSVDDAGDPIFCGDAIADPLTGVHAAAAALAGVAAGGGLYDVSLAGVAAAVRATPFAEGRATDRMLGVPAPRPMAPHLVPASARPIGADDADDVLARWRARGDAPGRPRAEDRPRGGGAAPC